MKLFQQLLVAPAALGLFSPLAAYATEVNLNDIANYSDVESIDLANSFENNKSIKSPLLAGGEGLVDSDSYDGGFSSTTTASFSADFLIGAVEGKGLKTSGASQKDGDEDIQAAYSFQIDLNTSFTGEDSLDISIDAGNALAEPSSTESHTSSPLLEFDPNTNGDTLAVDGVSYTFPVGDKLTVIVGDNTDGSALFTTACTYGGGSDTMADCGAPNAGITGGGVALGAAYDIGSGFTAGFAFQSDPTGIATKETKDAYGLNLAYTADSYGASVTYGNYEKSTNEKVADYYTAINGYYTLDNGISLSAGYEQGTLGDTNALGDETSAYFVGVTTEAGPGTLGVAFGTNGSQTEVSGTITESMMYEAFYAYPVNDGMTITPLIYTKEVTTAGLPDETGIMVKTSFSF